MISQFGDTALFFALALALVQSALPLWGYWRRNPYALACARPAALGQFAFVLIAYALLTYAFAISDFSLAYVAANSHASLPLMYKLTAIWGAHEGSILLWIVILNAWTFAFSFLYHDDNDLKALTLAILGCISVCFLLFLLLTSNPFIEATEWQAGRDLNPLLQDPGFVIHPPMLYAGYVGFAAAFAFTLAALIANKMNRAWAQTTRHYAIAAWCFLTFGIMLGSWWAYRVLGWGGFWFWDPVENASLLPWLAGIALIHVLVLVDKRNVAIAWAVFLALVSFALSLMGTFLVRSGILVSVHTFASDPSRGIFLLLLLAALVTIAFAIYTLRMPTVNVNTPSFSWLSRESSLLINSGLLFIAMTTILLGTIYPLILDVLHLGVISVGAPYFNMVMMPLVFILMACMGAGVLCAWQVNTVRDFLALAWKKILLSVIAAPLFLWCVIGYANLPAVIGLTLSFWIVLSILSSLRIHTSMALAHLGFAVLVIGILLSSLLNVEREVRIHPGQAVMVGPYQFFFVDTQGVAGSNYRGVRAEFDVLKNARQVTRLYPEKRIYTVRDMVMTKVDIHPGIFRDLYIALGEPIDQTSWSVRIYYKPFIRWIWFGGMLMVFGGIVGIVRRRQVL